MSDDAMGDPQSTTAEHRFVGRESELERLEAALDAAAAGSGRVVLIVGEPGIGKTYLCDQLAMLARRRGFAVMLGVSYEQPGAPPCWPWMQALGGYLAQVGVERLVEELGDTGGVLAELLPELRAYAPNLAMPTPLPDPQSARFRMLDAAATFLRRVAAAQPLLIILDDLHWADAASLQLLEFVARGLPRSRLLLVGTYREVELRRQHPLAHTLAELTRAQLIERLPVRGWSKPEVHAVIESLVGIQPISWLADEVHDRTEGNPLFVSEVLRLLREDGELERLAGTPERQSPVDLTVRLPEGVREVIGRRLDRLADATVEMLRLAAVVGRDFSLRQLEAVSAGGVEGELVALLDEAVAAHLIVESRRPDAYRFSHSLIQETLLDELSAARRVRLHTRIAEALDSLYAEEPDLHLEELAYHFGEAEPLLGPERCIRYSLRAGEQALARHAPRNALDHFERVVAMTAGQPVDAARAAGAFGKARALTMYPGATRIREQLVLLNTAFEFYLSAGDIRRALAAAATLAPNYLSFGKDLDSAVVALQERALSLTRPGSIEAARLIVDYALVRCFVTGDHGRSSELYAQALAASREADDPALEVRLLLGECVLLWYAGAEHPHRLLARALELAARVSDPDSEMRAHFLAARFSLTSEGDLAAAIHHAHFALERAALVQDRGIAGSLRVFLAHHYLLVGDWESAREQIRLHLELNESVGLRLMRVRLAWALGDHTEVERLLDQAAPEAEGTVLGYVATALGLAHYSRVASVERWRERAARLLTTAHELTGPPIPLLQWYIDRAEAMIELAWGDRARCQRLYQMLREQPPLQTIDWFTGMAAERAVALLAGAAGDVDAAAEHLEAAIEASRRSGYRPELAWCCDDYAELLDSRARAPDRSRAAELLKTALEVARRLAMVGLEERITRRIASRAGAAGGQDTVARPRSLHGLTTREVEILRLVARGLSNREVAHQLSISSKTVATHLGNAYAKLGVANRAEATAYIVQHRLLAAESAGAGE